MASGKGFLRRYVSLKWYAPRPYSWHFHGYILKLYFAEALLMTHVLFMSDPPKKIWLVGLNLMLAT